MAENDIYNSKQKYETFKKDLHELVLPPEKRQRKQANAKYYCKNPINLDYFKKIFNTIESKDLSYARRNRLLSDMKLIVHNTEKDLKDLTGDDVDEMRRFGKEV